MDMVFYSFFSVLWYFFYLLNSIFLFIPEHSSWICCLEIWEPFPITYFPSVKWLWVLMLLLSVFGVRNYFMYFCDAYSFSCHCRCGDSCLGRLLLSEERSCVHFSFKILILWNTYTAVRFKTKAGHIIGTALGSLFYPSLEVPLQCIKLHACALFLSGQV